MNKILKIVEIVKKLEDHKVKDRSASYPFTGLDNEDLRIAKERYHLKAINRQPDDPEEGTYDCDLVGTVEDIKDFIRVYLGSNSYHERNLKIVNDSINDAEEYIPYSYSRYWWAILKKSKNLMLFKNINGIKKLVLFKNKEEAQKECDELNKGKDLGYFVMDSIHDELPPQYKQNIELFKKIKRASHDDFKKFLDIIKEKYSNNESLYNTLSNMWMDYRGHGSDTMGKELHKLVDSIEDNGYDVSEQIEIDNREPGYFDKVEKAKKEGYKYLHTSGNKVVFAKYKNIHDEDGMGLIPLMQGDYFEYEQDNGNIIGIESLGNKGWKITSQRSGPMIFNNKEKVIQYVKNLRLKLIHDSKIKDEFDDTKENIDIIRAYLNKYGKDFNKKKDGMRLLKYIEQETGIKNADYGDVLYILENYTNAKIYDSKVKDKIDYYIDGDKDSGYILIDHHYFTLKGGKSKEADVNYFSKLALSPMDFINILHSKGLINKSEIFTDSKVKDAVLNEDKIWNWLIRHGAKESDLNGIDDISSEGFRVSCTSSTAKRKIKKILEDYTGRKGGGDLDVEYSGYDGVEVMPGIGSIGRVEVELLDSINDAGEVIIDKYKLINAIKNARIPLDDTFMIGNEYKGWLAKIEHHGIDYVEINKHYSTKTGSLATGRIWKDGKMVHMNESPLINCKEKMIQFLKGVKDSFHDEMIPGIDDWVIKEAQDIVKSGFNDGEDLREKIQDLSDDLLPREVDQIIGYLVRTMHFTLDSKVKDESYEVVSKYTNEIVYKTNKGKWDAENWLRNQPFDEQVAKREYLIRKGRDSKAKDNEKNYSYHGYNIKEVFDDDPDDEIMASAERELKNNYGAVDIIWSKDGKEITYFTSDKTPHKIKLSELHC